MNFDRNTVIGFVVLALLFFGYFYYNNKEQAAHRKQKAIQDSIALATRPKTDSAIQRKDSVFADSIATAQKDGFFQNTSKGNEEHVYIENKVFRITFSTKGGQPKAVELKNFKNADSSRVRLAGSSFDKIDYGINTGSNAAARIVDRFFVASAVTMNPDSSQTVSFTLPSDSAGPSVTHRFTVKKDDYMIDFDILMNRADQLLGQPGTLNLTWQYKAMQQERDISFEKTNTQIGYVMDDEFDYHTIGRRSSKEYSDPVKWVGVRQQFFTTILVAKNSFKSGKIEWNIPPDAEKTIVQTTATLSLQPEVLAQTSIPLSIYYGPSDYRILKQYDMQMAKLVNLGQGIYSFVRPINKYIVLPVFDFLAKLVNNYGMAIMLLTIFIRLLTSPLMYPGYKTSAQMKILKPDLKKLKEKYPDQQQFAMEQMKFMREAGVNQFAGCLPALLQIPIFFSLYSFFNANVDLRGQSFLWADDLSAYDSILNLGFTIPLYGDHVSLFTITACLTSFLISWYGMSSAADQGNPVLKYMPYIFPFILLFIFNRLPSALTWYYTVSNVITLGLQFVIQHYIINHEKLLKKMDESRKKPKTKSKWQERLEQMQEMQKQRQKELQNKKR
jgi:YidC/Oxa1 family membrane protein insertase